MAEKRTLARPYAKAVFQIAEETKAFDSWATVLNILSMAVQDARVILLLKDETIDLNKIVFFLVGLCPKNLETTHIENFIRILALKKRLSILPQITDLYFEMKNATEKIIPIQLTAATALNDTQKKTVQTHLADYFQCAVTMEIEIDPQLLGGFVARAGNYVIDNSVRGFLGNLKMAMGDQQ